MKIVLYTPEMSAVDMALLFEAQKKGIADEIDVDYTQEGKTPWERLRNVIYAVYKEKKLEIKHPIFDEYYRLTMEWFIKSQKDELPKL